MLRKALITLVTSGIVLGATIGAATTAFANSTPSKVPIYGEPSIEGVTCAGANTETGTSGFGSANIAAGKKDVTATVNFAGGLPNHGYVAFIVLTGGEGCALAPPPRLFSTNGHGARTNVHLSVPKSGATDAFVLIYDPSTAGNPVFATTDVFFVPV
jgi:hypothetical protein